MLPLSEYLVHTLGCNAIRSLDSPTAADFLDHIGAGSWVESFAFDIFELADGLCDRGVAFEELLADRGVYAGEFGDVLLELVHGHCRTEQVVLPGPARKYLDGDVRQPSAEVGDMPELTAHDLSATDVLV